MWANERAVPGGFRRESPLPPATATIRLRDELALVAGGRVSVARGLATVGRWQNLTPLVIGPWFGDVVRSPRHAPRTIERRLIVLGTPTTTLTRARQAAAGSVVKLAGVVRSLARSPAAAGPALSTMEPVWENSTRRGSHLCHFVEEGRDFFLEAGDEGLPVLAAGGQLLAATEAARVMVGDAVEVLGFVDHVVDPAASAGPGRAPPLQTVVRSGDALSLLLWKAA